MTKKILIFFTFGLLLFLFYSFSQHQAFAASPLLSNDSVKNGTLKWIDRAHIKATFGDASIIFFDADITDGDYNYRALDYSTCSHAEIDLVTYVQSERYVPDYTNSAKLDIDIKSPDVVNSSCENTDPNKIDTYVFQNTNQFHVVYAQVDNDTIANVDGNTKWVFIKSPLDPNLYVQKDNSDECPNLLVVNGDTYKIYELADSSYDHIDEDHPIDNASFHLGSVQCYNKLTNGGRGDSGVDTNKSYPLGILSTNPDDGGVLIGDSDSADDTAGGSDDEDSCESSGGAMSWIMCPVAKLLDGVFGTLAEQIESLLNIEKDRYTNSDLKDAWKNMRNIAYIILVPIMLVMVISTALGFEFISAYTVKKALPRMLAAVIFIALSWEITTFLVGFFNVIGQGIAGLILTPFDLQDNGISQIFNPGAAQSTGQWAFLGVGIGLVAFSSTVLGIVLSFLGTASLILLTVFVFLVARQMFILLLIVVAPLAILAWIFPGNDKLWKSWWNMFSKLLMMYPIIIGLVSIGLVFGSIIGDGSTGNAGHSFGERLSDILSPLMKVAAFIIPYAMIPLSFKFVGGLIGNLTSAVNERQNGPHGIKARMRAKRGAMYSRGWKEAKAGSLINRGGSKSDGFGRAISAVASGPRGWVSSKKRAAFRETGLRQAGAEFLESDPIVKANKGDDKFLLALASRGTAERKMKKAQDEAEQYAPDSEEKRRKLAEAEMWQQSISKASLVKNQTRSTRMAAAAAWAGSGYNFASGQAGYNELAGVVAEASGAKLDTDPKNGNAIGATGANAGAYRSFMNEAQFNLKNAGRYDLGGINHGAGYSYKSGIDKAGGYQASQAKPETHVAGAAWAFGDDFVGADDKTIEGPEFEDKLRTKLESGQINMDNLATHHRNLVDAFSGATGGNKTEIGKQLDAIEAVTIKNPLNPDGTPYRPATEEGLNRTLEARERIEKNRRDVYRGQPQDRAVLNELNNPPPDA